MTTPQPGQRTDARAVIMEMLRRKRVLGESDEVCARWILEGLTPTPDAEGAELVADLRDQAKAAGLYTRTLLNRAADFIARRALEQGERG